MFRGRTSLIIRILNRLSQDRAGGIGLIVGLSLPVVVGSVGLAFDINRGLEQRIINQRAADMAALGAAMAFKAGGNAAVLQPTATDIGNANGVADAAVTASVVGDFPNSGDQSVRVLVTSQVPFTLARVLGLAGSYSVEAASFASLSTQAQYATPCFLALSSENNAFVTSGGASVNAPGCSIATMGSIDHGSNLITAHDVIAGSGNIRVDYGNLNVETARYGGRWNVPEWNLNVPAADHRFNQATALLDPWADNVELANAKAMLGSFEAPAPLTNPDTSTCSGAQDWKLDWDRANPMASHWTGSGYDIPAGTYCIRRLSAGGGLTIRFASGSNIYISNGFANGGGTTVNFGDSNLYVNGGFDSGSSGVTIGNGTLWLGGGNAISFKGTNRKGDGDVTMNGTITLTGGQTLVMGKGRHRFGGFSLGPGSTVTMGDGDLSVGAGIKVDGGSEMAVGDGNVLIGRASDGNAIKLGGTGRLLMGNGRFSANGRIDTEGNSRIVFGTTDNHFINGDMRIRGGALFGPGRYTVNGFFENGTGGAKWPYTSSLNGKTYGNSLGGHSVSGFDMAGVDVTFILSGTFNLAGGAQTKLVAANSGTGGAIGEMLVFSETQTAMSWTEGSGNVFSGVVYLPRAPLTMSGGNATSGAGDCFSLIAYRIALQGGATAGTACTTMAGNAGSGSSGAIRLVR